MINKLLVKLFEKYCRTVLSTYAPVEVFGRENLPQKPYLIYSNHTSHLDYLILSIFSDLGFQKTCVLVAKDYWFDNRIRHWFANVFFNAIPVDRTMLFRPEAIEEIIAGCQKKIDRGGRNRSLIIFPEGKRSKDGKIQDFKIGPAAIANELNLKVVPAFIDGPYHVWPKGRSYMKPGKIKLVFGEAARLHTPDENDVSSISDYKSDTDTLKQLLIELKEKFEARQD